MSSTSDQVEKEVPDMRTARWKRPRTRIVRHFELKEGPIRPSHSFFLALNPLNYAIIMEKKSDLLFLGLVQWRGGKHANIFVAWPKSKSLFKLENGKQRPILTDNKAVLWRLHLKGPGKNWAKWICTKSSDLQMNLRFFPKKTNLLSWCTCRASY